MTPYIIGLAIGGVFGIWFVSLIFNIAILGGPGTKLQRLWVVALTGATAIGFSAFGEGEEDFATRIWNLPQPEMAIAYALATLVVMFIVSRSKDDVPVPPTLSVVR